MDYSYLEALYDRCFISLDALRIAETNLTFTSSFQTLLETLSLQQDLLKTHRERSHQAFLSRNVEKGSEDNHSADRCLELNERKAARMASIKDMEAPSEVNESMNGFSDIIGLEDAKILLKEACIFPLQFSHLFTDGGVAKPWSRILLYGPPGTGKTRLARALAAELKGHFYCASSASLLSSWIGESEKLIRDLFQSARSRDGSSIIFIDEIDSLCRERTQTEDEHSRRVKTELLRQLDSSADETGGGRVFVLAATNCPWDMDSAFLRRFQQRILINIPKKDDRKSILMSPFNQDSLQMSDLDWERISGETEGFSGADLSHLAMSAAYKPIRELHTARFWNFTEGNKIVPCPKDTLGAMQFSLDKIPPEKVTTRPVELRDFVEALKSTPKTVSEDDLQKYEDFAKL